MVESIRRLCDLCLDDKDVDTITVSYGKNPWEADLCAKHYKELFSLLQSKGRRATRSNVRPQHRFQKLDENAFTV